MNFSRCTGMDLSLHNGAENPGSKLLFADSLRFTFTLFAASHVDHGFKNLFSHFLRTDTIQYLACIKIHVAFHTFVESGIAGNFDGWGGLETEAGAATCGEDNDVGTARDLSSNRDGVVAGRIHDDQTTLGDRLGVFVD